MEDTDPLGVFLVKSGSKGDRLLFRYPYSQNEPYESFEQINKKNPYTVIQPKREDLYSPKKKRAPRSDEIGLFNFNDKDLSNLFAVKSELCGQQFELKIENVRFVGHPTYLRHEINRESSTTLTMFHVVFALKAIASHSIVNSYHDLSHRLSMAIIKEEGRSNFLTDQVKLMQIAQDEIASNPEDYEESLFHLILQRCQLATYLQILYEDLRKKGTVSLKVNDWIEVSFCLPCKVHRLYDERLNIGPESIQNSLKALRPYHGILFLVDVNELLMSLPEDTLPALVRLIKVTTPLKNLQQLAADADIILSNVFQIVGHLLYWCKAMVIYPLCDNNVYVVSPHAFTNMNSRLVDLFKTVFPGKSLLAIMNKFSLPTSLSNLADSLKKPNEQVPKYSDVNFENIIENKTEPDGKAQLVKMVTWLLQHRLIMQLHTYITMLPISHRLNGHRTSNNKHQNGESPKCSESITNLHSYQSEESLLSTSSLSNTHSKSSSEEDVSLREQDFYHLTELTHMERIQILRESSPENNRDLKNILKLCDYLKGHHHLEEIMYFENIPRAHLLDLIEKFPKVLVTYQYEDPAVAPFYNYL